MNREGIRKPAFFAYKYLAELGDTELKNSDKQSWITRKGNAVAALVWDFTQPVQSTSNRPFYTKVFPTKDIAPVILSLQGIKPGKHRVKIYRTGFKANDAHTAYLEMGSPATVTPAQILQLQNLTEDKPVVTTLNVSKSGSAELSITMRANDVVMVMIN